MGASLTVQQIVYKDHPWDNFRVYFLNLLLNYKSIHMSFLWRLEVKNEKVSRLLIVSKAVVCVSTKGFMHTITYFFVYSPHRINGRGTWSLRMRVQVQNSAYILLPLWPCCQILASLFSTCLDFTFSPSLATPDVVSLIFIPLCYDYWHYFP